MGSKLINSSPYHPRTNGQIERPHQTLKNKLRGLMEVKPEVDWAELLPEAVFLYNNSRHRSTKYRPCIVEGFLWEGRYPNINKIDINQEELQRIHQEVGDNLKKAAESREKRYNKKAKVMQVSVGDEVFVREGKSRKRDKFPYKGVVVEVFPNCIKLRWLNPPEGKERGQLSDRTYAFDQIKVFQSHKDLESLGIQELFGN